MALFKPDEWTFTEKARELVTTNPFHPTWRDLEAEIMGRPPRNVPVVIAWRPGVHLWGPQSLYSEEVDQQITEMGERLRQRLLEGVRPSQVEWDRYELLSVYRLYCEYGRAMDLVIDAAVKSKSRRPRKAERPDALKALWGEFRRKYDSLLCFKNLNFPLKYKPEHVFACFFLFRRAFYHIFFNIVGTSKPIAELRTAVWQSIVTHDLVGWMQGLYPRMKDFPTLITGQSGTGKERVAEAIGQSLYIPFDPAKRADANTFLDAYNPVNLSALSPQLIESELFGHVEGAFTGANADHVGRLEKCLLHGAVFLDEIGELTAEIQVKLLRVLQERCFQSVGANEDKPFLGKIIAATNRNLATEIQAGSFREDFYYRLCADQIRTPSLREQLADSPEDLSLLVEFVCRPVVGEERAAEFAREVVTWIEQHLRGYAWPGNFRELGQCVRSYTIRKNYQPIRASQSAADHRPAQPPDDPVAEACGTLASAVLNGKTSYKKIRQRLFALVRSGSRTKKEAATLLGFDVRTLEAGMQAKE